MRLAAGTHPDGPVADLGPRLSVVHVVTALGTGGAERQVELLVAGSEHETRTVALYDAGPVAASMRAAGHPVDVLGMAGWRRLVAPIRLARLLRRLRPDVVHVHLLAAQLWGIPAARLARVPVVVSSEHSLMDDSIEGRPLSPALRLVYLLLERMATRTVAVSATTADRLVRWGVARRRIAVSDNGIDFERLRFDEVGRRRVRAELGLGDDVRTIVAVGRLEAVKRMDLVIRAGAEELAAGAHLVVAGTGALQPGLAALADELGVADRVHLLGARADVAAVLSAGAVLVSASADETFGMAVVEGLAAGLPVVYVECPALEELPEQPPHAHRVERTDDPARTVALLAHGIRAALAPRRTPQRHAVSPALTERYGAPGACRRTDALYRELVG